MSARGIDRWLKRALIALSPLLAAPYFHSCITPTHGVFPLSCQVGLPSCGTMAQQALDKAELKLGEAQVTGITIIAPADNHEFANHVPCFDVGAIPAVFDPWREDHSDCWLPVIGSTTTFNHVDQCSCYWNVGIDIPATSKTPAYQSPLLADLRNFVAYKPCRTGRSALIQLGWVFFTSRSVPAYLKKTKFDAPAMLTAFARYWDHVSEVLAQPENGGDGAQFVISIGNELNAYLSQPITDIDGDAASAWESYARFYVKAARYVKGESVDLDGDGAPDPNLSHTAELALPPQPTFTLTMSDECDVRKIVNAVAGDYVGDTCLLPGDVQQRIGQALLAMMGESSFWTFTRYPIWDLSDNPTSDELAGRAHDGVLAAFQTFGDLSRKVAKAGYTSSPRPILMQEVGYPSSFAKVDGTPLLQQQAAVVRGAFAGWEDYLAPYRANALAAMSSSPPVLGFNWLPLHDFPPDSDGGCPVRPGARGSSMNRPAAHLVIDAATRRS